MDVVYPLSNSYTGEELKYSLRSLSNIPHDKVFFVGGCPKWAKNVIHIPNEQTGTKWQNVPKNLIKVCQDERVSANFIYMNDDFFILEPIKTKDLNLYNGTIQSVYNKLAQRHSTPTNYMVGMLETQEFLKGLGIENPLSYELHTPIVFNKKKLLKALEREDIKHIDVLHYRSLYGNLYLKGGIDMRDVKVFMRNGFVPKNAGKFLSCDAGGFYILQHYLSCKFPQKSDYEI